METSTLVKLSLVSYKPEMNGDNSTAQVTVPLTVTVHSMSKNVVVPTVLISLNKPNN